MQLNHKTASKTLHNTHRLGFTLIELMVVIVIIGILMALILPALAGVRRRAAVSEQAAEFAKIDTAIATFTSDMGVEPWSEIVLNENPSSTNPWNPISMTRIRRIWPTFDFGLAIDFNADGAITGDSSGNGTIILTGSECLVFFLGGALTRDTDGDGAVSPTEANGQASHIGFSKNPNNPCSMTGSNRQGPWYTFDVNRLKDLDGDGMPEYYPTLGDQNAPIHFASSNNGQGYFSGVSIYVQADGRTAWNKDSHQLIAAGFDNDLGFLPYAGLKMTYANAESLNGRPLEVDNVTNFKQGSTLGD